MPEDAPVPHEELAALRRRVAELEAERDRYAQQNAELFVLQQIFSTMNSTLDTDDILATVLRGIRETLRFGRVVLFDVHDGVASRRLETGPDGDVSDFAFGIADDGDSPLADAQGTYCMLPLISRNTVRGILYVDRPPSMEIGEAQLRMLLDFAAHAAIAMENARLHGETKRLLQETQRLASTDPLTGLANRRALTELLDRELHNAERYGAPLAFLIFDLDGLKEINDGQGHAAGDQALRDFADVIRANARRGDIAARIGGDEFVLVMTQTDRIPAEAVLRRLYATLARSGLRSSAGIALFPRHGADGTVLFAAADRALYEAKQAGKNRFRFAPDPA
jgi:diguanylate cyclase (GGDEF)-like protein